MQARFTQKAPTVIGEPIFDKEGLYTGEWWVGDNQGGPVNLIDESAFMRLYEPADMAAKALLATMSGLRRGCPLPRRSGGITPPPREPEKDELKRETGLPIFDEAAVAEIAKPETTE